METSSSTSVVVDDLTFISPKSLSFNPTTMVSFSLTYNGTTPPTPATALFPSKGDLTVVLLSFRSEIVFRILWSCLCTKEPGICFILIRFTSFTVNFIIDTYIY